MKIVGLFCKLEQKVGFKLGGIDSRIVKNLEELNTQLKEIKKDNSIGILLISEDVYNMSKKDFDDIEKSRYPLLQIIDT